MVSTIDCRWDDVPEREVPATGISTWGTIREFADGSFENIERSEVAPDGGRPWTELIGTDLSMLLRTEGKIGGVVLA